MIILHYFDLTLLNPVVSVRKVGAVLKGVHVHSASASLAMLKCIQPARLVEELDSGVSGGAVRLEASAAAVGLCELSLALAQCRLRSKQSLDNNKMGKDMFTSAAECVRIYLLSTLVDDR